MITHSYFKNYLSQNQKAFVTFGRQKFEEFSCLFFGQEKKKALKKYVVFEIASRAGALDRNDEV